MELRRPLLVLPALILVTTGIGSAASGSGSAAARSARTGYGDSADYGFQGEGPGRIHDADHRAGRLLPTEAQRKAARDLGAVVRWNEFGTPHVLTRDTGHLSGPATGPKADVARAWVRDHRTLFRLDAAGVEPARLELLADTPLYEAPDQRRRLQGLAPRHTDVAHVVLFRQRFGGRPAGAGGLLTVGVTRAGEVTWVSSSVTGDTTLRGRAALDGAQAWRAAADDVGRPVAPDALALVQRRDHAGFAPTRVAGRADVQRARLVAVPTPRDGVRLAWETVVLQAHPADGHGPTAFIHFVDAETGRVWVRRNRVDHLDDPGEAAPTTAPWWRVFPANPGFVDPASGTGSPDDRQYWCWTAGSGCDVETGHHDDGPRRFASPYAYDVNAPSGAPTFTTKGNNAETAPSYVSQLTPDNYVGPVSATRTYDFPFTDQWFEKSCSSANFGSPERNDIDAATTNLFVMHNRMHDWSYFLGFTESTWNMQRYNFGEDHPDSAKAKANDPETGQAQAGAVPGGIAFLGRDNANQVTLQDGVPGVTNQYLWHPLQAGFYSPCVDGAYDMSVVGHEYTHAISNRMTAGPDDGLDGAQATAMGESWSDLAAVEYMAGYGVAPIADENPYAVGPYVTGNKQTGIRNYAMNESPLNYSDLGYDGNGATSPHSDGEVWSATNFDLRSALVAAYGKTHPYADKKLQYRCAEGLLPADQCPGNRRWIQIMFDGFLLQPGDASMVDARDAQLAADRLRFRGANQGLLWDAYAHRGLGKGTDSAGTVDSDPTPGWTSPLRKDHASISFQAQEVDGGGVAPDMYVYVGRYEARATEVAVATRGEQSGAVDFAPGRYELVAEAAGYGHYRFTATFAPNQTRVVRVPMRRNLASETNGAEASGDGGNHTALIDDTEDTNWASLAGPVEGKQVTVALAGGRQHVAEVQVSAALRPARTDSYDSDAQNRFSALRSFEILTCDEMTGADCESEDGYSLVYRSAPDAFPGARPRPLAPNLALRGFDVTDSEATHVRLRVLTNQCTGGPDFTGAANPMDDPASDPDCVSGFELATAPETTNTQAERVRVAELQVFAQPAPGARVRPATPPRPVPPRPAPPRPGPPAPGRTPLAATGAELPVGLALALGLGAAVAVRLRRS